MPLLKKELMQLPFISLAVLILAAALQPVPGYMDAEYYYVGGIRLVTGYGFTEPFLWNYLDQPTGLPHPSHTYWMPLASILSAIGMAITGAQSFLAGRWPFILLAAIIPILAVKLAEELGASPASAQLSGWLAIFPGYYLVFSTLTETFVIYMLGGSAFFLILASKDKRLQPGMGWMRYVLLGLVAGYMHASRADGILWFGLAGLVWLDEHFRRGFRDVNWHRAIRHLLALILAYLLIMAAWYARNLSLYGVLMPPGGSRTLWMTDYDQTFAFPSDALTPSNWLAAGIQVHLVARVHALWMNIKNLIAVQAEVFLLPLIAIGAWQNRHKKIIRFGILGWLLTLLLMTIVFPYSGSRGGYLHSGAAFQPLFWACAAVGLDTAIALGVRRRGWSRKKAGIFFSRSLILLVAGITTVVFLGRVISPGLHAPKWSDSQRSYSAVGSRLDQLGVPEDAIVLVNNPPGFFLSTGRQSIVIPDGGEENLLAVAEQYGANYLVLDGNNPKLIDLYQSNHRKDGFSFIETIGTMKLFQIHYEP